MVVVTVKITQPQSQPLLRTTYYLEKPDIYHREQANLKLYEDYWKSKPHVNGQFFNWLDHGPGKSVSLDSCPRYQLDGQRVYYVGNGQRKPFRVIFSNGRLVYKSDGRPVNTISHDDTIYVLSPKNKFYVAKKVRNVFHHTSFMSGGDVICAGHLHVNNGKLESLSHASGHYKPTAASFELMKQFLRGNNVDLRNVRMSAW